MSPEEMETFQISTPVTAPGFPRTFRARLRELGSGAQVDRQMLAQLCGSTSAANHFLDEATDVGALIPVAWGEYRVAGERTLGLISRLNHPPLQRFIAWAWELPELADGDLLFVAPWLWRDTQLNVTHPMPLIPLDHDEGVVQGSTPQWDAFHMDVAETRVWKLEVGDEDAGTFRTPGPLEVVMLLRASLEPRWKEAAAAIGDAWGTQGLAREMHRLRLHPAPRGRETVRVGKGLPARRRLLAPPWYMERVNRHVGALALGEGGV